MNAPRSNRRPDGSHHWRQRRAANDRFRNVFAPGTYNSFGYQLALALSGIEAKVVIALRNAHEGQESVVVIEVQSVQFETLDLVSLIPEQALENGLTRGSVGLIS
ncbi:hypothetical protein MBE54_003432 [Klebsiella pneumoniae]|uniref:hypothetical protein n=1 Tax=Enterobacteriaceae TaxID=543 RepID=UPI00115B262F|nr:hypothetical protein [Klebsiella pneumoniae]ELY2785150.1 hypothetical protein [Cronobacter turicensis]ELA0994048.1 hypothetical protein [Klebsiella pneumoniae]MCU8675164.1 hypothetical protein [Klebsiella pneumoniae]MCU8688523.1 hypothetical protein [Klebsiella pneumoniae]HBR3463623.1 hypothetical protein [Klebsiella pneumoniae]